MKTNIKKQLKTTVFIAGIGCLCLSLSGCGLMLVSAAMGAGAAITDKIATKAMNESSKDNQPQQQQNYRARQ